MASQSYCSQCGSFIEADCDFCTSCGAPKQQTRHVSQPPPAPHPWMLDPAPPVGGSPRQAGDPTPSYQQPLTRPPYPPHTYQPVHALQPAAVAMGANVSPPQAYGAPQKEKTTTAQVSLVIAILMLSLTLVALVPCLGWLNWANLLVLAEVQHIAWWISFFTERNATARGKRLLSLPFIIIAIFVGIFRLALGGGCL
jgi:hypothetical protein